MDSVAFAICFTLDIHMFLQSVFHHSFFTWLYSDILGRKYFSKLHHRLSHLFKSVLYPFSFVCSAFKSTENVDNMRNTILPQIHVPGDSTFGA